MDATFQMEAAKQYIDKMMPRVSSILLPEGQIGFDTIEEDLRTAVVVCHAAHKLG